MHRNVYRAISAVAVLTGLAIAFAAGRATGPTPEADAPIADISHDHEGHADAAEEYVCPMHPQIRQDTFGTCPICHMDLVPIASGGDGASGVALEDHAAALAQVQTAHVERPPLERRMRLFGRVTTNQEGDASITAWTGGRIDRLYVETIGETVERGQRLARIYSPELVRAQETLLHAIRNRDEAQASGSDVRSRVADEVVAAARDELRLLGMSSRDIDQIVEDGEASEYVTLRAPARGTLLERHVREGDHVVRGTPLLTLAQLDDVWVALEVPESRLPRLRVGDAVELELAGVDHPLDGEIAFIEPVIDGHRRVGTARVVLENTDGALRPEMFVDATVVQPLVNRRGLGPISVPASAVLWTGERSLVYRVDRAHQPPRYVPTEVRLGERVQDRYVIAHGVWTGEEVVVNGAFRVDASAQILGQPSMMQPSEAAAPAGGGHAHE